MPAPRIPVDIAAASRPRARTLRRDEVPVPVELLVHTPNPDVPQSTKRSAKAKKVTPEQLAAEAALTDRLIAPTKANSIAVLGNKGGTGKTTVAVHLGLLLAAARRGPIIAVDADAETRSLGWMLGGDSLGVPPLAAVVTSRKQGEPAVLPVRTDSGLQVIASGDGGRSDFNHTKALQAVQRAFDVAIVDFGSSVEQPSSKALFAATDIALIVTSPNRAGIRSAVRTLDWLDATGSSHEAIVVINGMPAEGGEAFLDQAISYFDERGAGVATIPFDTYIGGGEFAAFDQLEPATQSAYRVLAATVIDTLRTHVVFRPAAIRRNTENKPELRVLENPPRDPFAVSADQPTHAVARQREQGAR